MTDDKSKSLDILGIKPVADSISIVTKGVVDGASAFLSRVCLPAAEELGFLFQDKVRRFRAANAAKVASKAERIMNATGGYDGLQAPPRLIGMILDNGSWVDADSIQDMWAGLLASSCSANGDDDSNLMFIDLLGKMSRSQARLFDCVCRRANVVIAPNGLLAVTSEIVMDVNELQEVCGLSDIHHLDRELDHLRTIGLIPHIEGGFDMEWTIARAQVTPTPLALQMFAKINGHRGPVGEFFNAVPRA